MRLLRTSTFKLESFFNENPPPYAILSHTWGDEEISFQELQQEDATALLTSTKARVVRGEPLHEFHSMRKGFAKILGCALQAEKDGLEYIWCDTCCIDKTNSTELSEAINSMYQWYNGQMCYAYLTDVSHDGLPNSTETKSALAESRWLTRGWTLQELIAPAQVVFFDKAWQVMGTRSDFKDVIVERTGIDGAVLDGQDPRLFSVAKRMSWAAQRQTTRVEDHAYCLMGLFGVNLPLIYGEKQKAFLRLQEEIMKSSDDHSLFAWKTPADLEHIQCGLLATSPAYFAQSRNIGPFHGSDINDSHLQSPSSTTSRGVRISLRLLSVLSELASQEGILGVYVAALDCQDAMDARGPLGIYLVHHIGGYYRRCNPHRLIRTSNVQGAVGEVDVKTIYVAQDLVAPKAEATTSYRFHIPELDQELSQHGVILKVFANPRIASWDCENRLLCCSRGLAGSMFIGRVDGSGQIWLIGVDSRLRVRCRLDDASDIQKWSLDDWTTKAKARTKLELAQALLPYRSEGPGVPGNYENMLNDKAMRRSIAMANAANYKSAGRFETRLTNQINRERQRDWDRWVSRSGKDSGRLNLGFWTAVERPNPWFFQRKMMNVWNDLHMKITTTVTQRVVDGQTMFTVRFLNTKVD